MLSVHLEDGFAGDEVVVSLDGVVVHHLQDVSTQLLLGYARVVPCATRGNTALLGVEVVNRGLQGEAVVPGDGAVIVSIQGAEIELQYQEEPRGYL
jgi:hypothetical protein